ncbi:MAG: hypothetical protein K2Q10_03610 [Rhodospirillales bacterium]|nr:hypothetical protein [Rhodospirillales bacterium]
MPMPPIPAFPLPILLLLAGPAMAAHFEFQDGRLLRHVDIAGSRLSYGYEVPTSQQAITEIVLLADIDPASLSLIWTGSRYELAYTTTAKKVTGRQDDQAFEWQSKPGRYHLVVSPDSKLAERIAETLTQALSPLKGDKPKVLRPDPAQNLSLWHDYNAEIQTLALYVRNVGPTAARISSIELRDCEAISVPTCPRTVTEPFSLPPGEIGRFEVDMDSEVSARLTWRVTVSLPESAPDEYVIEQSARLVRMILVTPAEED